MSTNSTITPIGSSTTSAALPVVVACASLNAHHRQVEPVEGKEAAYHGYSVEQARHRHVADHPEGRLVAGVRSPHEQHHQEVCDGGEALAPALVPEHTRRLGTPGEPQEPDEDGGDLYADQGEDERGHVVAAPGHAREELGRPRHHTSHYVHEAAHGVREVVVSSRPPTFVLASILALLSLGMPRTSQGHPNREGVYGDEPYWPCG